MKTLSGASRADAELLSVFSKAAIRPCITSLAEICSPALSQQALPQLFDFPPNAGAGTASPRSDTRDAMLLPGGKHSCFP